MSNQPKITKDARIDMRIPQALKEIWIHTANMRGSNLSDYIINSVSDRAILDEVWVSILSRQ